MVKAIQAMFEVQGFHFPFDEQAGVDQTLGNGRFLHHQQSAGLAIEGLRDRIHGKRLGKSLSQKQNKAEAQSSASSHKRMRKNVRPLKNTNRN